jgi:hypothetical protein
MAQDTVKTVTPVVSTSQDTTETTPVFLHTDVEVIANDCFDALGVSSTEDKLAFYSNAVLSAIKANLRAATARWDGIVAKYNKRHPAMTRIEAEAQVSKMRKFLPLYQEAKAAKALLDKKF